MKLGDIVERENEEKWLKKEGFRKGFFVLCCSFYGYG
jgi:hypothetical protein